MIDSQFATDTFKFISSSLNALSTMIFLELPHFSVFTKTDLLNLEQEQFLSKVLSCVSYDE
ncbi:MAG: GPN-loop GTPase 3, partial [Paramarteilia canceri]